MTNQREPKYLGHLCPQEMAVHGETDRDMIRLRVRQAAICVSVELRSTRKKAWQICLLKPGFGVLWRLHCKG